MKVALVGCGAEGIGLAYLSAALKQAGHETFLAFDPTLFDDKVFLCNRALAKLFDMKKETAEDIIRQKPDLVAISVVTDTYPWACAVAKMVKRSIGCPVIMGGTHPTFVPEEVIAEDCVDMVCIGEGEDAIAELANSLSKKDNNNSILNIWFKQGAGIIRNPVRPLKDNLDSLPFPDRSIYELYVNTRDSYLCMSARGCIYSCSYCFNNSLRKVYQGKGRYLRRRSPENFIAELEGALRRYNPKFFKIYDDIFTYDLNWLARFVDLYKTRINRPYFCLGHPHFMGEQAISLLKESGCSWIQIGVESFNKDTRSRISRNDTDDEIAAMAGNLDKYNLNYELDHIFGLPGDNEASYRKAADFYSDCKSLLKVNTNFLSYIPATDIINTAIGESMISREDLGSINKGLDGCRVTCGSERDAKKLKMYKDYAVLFKLIAAIPRWTIRVILKLKIYKCFGALDPYPGYLARLMVMDRVDRLYVKSVFRFLFYWFKRKLLHSGIELRKQTLAC